MKEQRSWPGRTAWLTRSELLGRTGMKRGEMAEIARRLNCSRERVRQLATKVGVRVQPGQPRFTECSDCGRRISRGRLGLCAECRHQRTLVTLTCLTCGKQFEYKDFIRRVTLGQRQGPR